MSIDWVIRKDDQQFFYFCFFPSSILILDNLLNTTVPLSFAVSVLAAWSIDFQYFVLAGDMEGKTIKGKECVFE